MRDKILGCLLGGAAGDAMGAATEARTAEQIIQIFGHRVTEFEQPPKDAIGHENVRGEVTDDFSLAYRVARQMVLDGGHVTEAGARKALLDWADNTPYYERFAGPSTCRAVKRIRAGEAGPKLPGNPPGFATNGAAMRAAPIGLFYPGDIEGAVADTVTASALTHDNQHALAGACAVSGAVAAALTEDADLFSVIDGGFLGASLGERIGRERYTCAPGASVLRRMELAVKIGLSHLAPWDKVREIGERIGSGLQAAEAVPAAFGLLAAFAGEPRQTIIGGVNIGYDTDTVATMAGAMAGALFGAQRFPDGYLALLEQVNHMDLRGLAEEILPLQHRREGRTR